MNVRRSQIQFILRSSFFVRLKDTVRKKKMWPAMAYGIKQSFPKSPVFEARSQRYQVCQFFKKLYHSFNFLKYFHIYFFLLHSSLPAYPCIFAMLRRKSYWSVEMGILFSLCTAPQELHRTPAALCLMTVCWPDARQESSIKKTDSRGIRCFVFGSKCGEILIYQD